MTATPQILPIKALKDNYIWMITNNRDAWIVDPGEAAPVLRQLQQTNYNLQGILITHHHHDHTGGIHDIQKSLRSLGHEVQIYAHQSSKVPGISRYLQDQETFSILDFEFQAISIPGHTLDHTAYYSESLNTLFAGDTLFSAGCGRIFEGNPPQMYQSLLKLARLPEETLLYCGHEYTLSNLKFAHVVEANNTIIAEKIIELKEVPCTLPSPLKIEKEINPFLRVAYPEVQMAVEKHFGRKLSGPVEVFAKLREWKNSF